MGEPSVGKKGVGFIQQGVSFKSPKKGTRSGNSATHTGNPEDLLQRKPEPRVLSERRKGGSSSREDVSSPSRRSRTSRSASSRSKKSIPDERSTSRRTGQETNWGPGKHGKFGGIAVPAVFKKQPTAVDAAVLQMQGIVGNAELIDEELIEHKVLLYRLVSLNCEGPWGMGKLLDIEKQNPEDDALRTALHMLLKRPWRKDPMRLFQMGEDASVGEEFSDVVSMASVANSWGAQGVPVGLNASDEGPGGCEQMDCSHLGLQKLRRLKSLGGPPSRPPCLLELESIPFSHRIHPPTNAPPNPTRPIPIVRSTSGPATATSQAACNQGLAAWTQMRVGARCWRTVGARSGRLHFICFSS